MDLKELKDQIQDLGKEIRKDALALSKAAADDSVDVAKIKTMKAALEEKRERHEALQASFTVQSEEEAAKVPVPTAAEEKTLTAMRGSNEYARAFHRAMSTGLSRKKGHYDEKCKVLYDALTIGGGDPVGEDGGFLVPEDIDHQIKELVRTLNPLSELFETETVGTISGWRVKDTAPTTGMAAVDEMGSIAEGEAPTFSKVFFTLVKYGMYLPVSNELANDEIANLFGYLARWSARKEVITANGLLLAELDDLTATAIAQGSELKGVKAVLNKVLDPMISINAALLTNQTGFDILDNMVDGTGRPLLTTDPKTNMPLMLKTRPIKMVSDAVLPNASGKAPIYIGDFKQYATIFQRGAMEMVSTDIGGNAFRTDSIEVRCLKRMDVSQFDSAAAALRTMTPEA